MVPGSEHFVVSFFIGPDPSTLEGTLIYYVGLPDSLDGSRFDGGDQLGDDIIHCFLHSSHRRHGPRHTF